jgi:hypothetical protein
MNHPERILRTLKHQSIDKIVWQPRIMYWFKGNQIPSLNAKTYTPEIAKFVPEHYVGMQIKDIYTDLQASIRYPGETLGIPMFYTQMKKDHKIEWKSTSLEDGSHWEEIITPVGKVTQKSRNGYHSEHMVKNIEDLKVVQYLIDQSEFYFNEFMYEAAVDEMEDFGIPTTYYFRSPYQRCVLEYLGFEKTVIFLRKYKTQMEQFMQHIADWDIQQYKNVICKSKLQLVNFGENIDHNLSPPRYFEKYLLPYYEERVKLLKQAGIHSFIHIDGSCKDLLPLLANLPFDGIEALTPEPQGDVTIKEIADNIGDKIVFDGIPATVFMPQFSEERLISTTQEVLERLAPNLILGVSDELPPNADGRRLKIVSELVEKFKM